MRQFHLDQMCKPFHIAACKKQMLGQGCYDKQKQKPNLLGGKRLKR